MTTLPLSNRALFFEQARALIFSYNPFTFLFQQEAVGVILSVSEHEVRVKAFRVPMDTVIQDLDARNANQGLMCGIPQDAVAQFYIAAPAVPGKPVVAHSVERFDLPTGHSLEWIMDRSLSLSGNGRTHFTSVIWSA